VQTPASAAQQRRPTKQCQDAPWMRSLFGFKLRFFLAWLRFSNESEIQNP
jgi:hypothetical protein